MQVACSFLSLYVTFLFSSGFYQSSAIVCHKVLLQRCKSYVVTEIRYIWRETQSLKCYLWKMCHLLFVKKKSRNKRANSKQHVTRHWSTATAFISRGFYCLCVCSTLVRLVFHRQFLVSYEAASFWFTTGRRLSFVSPACPERFGPVAPLEWPFLPDHNMNKLWHRLINLNDSFAFPGYLTHHPAAGLSVLSSSFWTGFRNPL